MFNQSKQYGLILKGKSGNTVSKTNVFNQSDSDSSNGESSSDWVKKSLKKSAENNQMKRDTKIAMQKALEEDSTVYQYDEVYDQMELKKSEAVKNKEKDRKPKYIEKLLQTSDKRKRENERRIERQVQKEREAEGEQFKDKESFVTTAYKKKLEEFAKLEEEERRQDMLEEIGDVTKQEDISGFYRHLYQTTVARRGDKMKTPEPEIKGKDKSKSAENKYKNLESKSNSESKAKESDDKSKTDKKLEMKGQNDDKKKENRNYRKRKQSESSDTNQDEDSTSGSSSSTSGDSSSSESGAEVLPKKDSKQGGRSESPPSKKVKNGDSKASVDTKKSSDNKKSNSPASKASDEKNKNEHKVSKKSTPDLSIWQKRTVGPVFDAALKRYFERKAVREMSKRKG